MKTYNDYAQLAHDNNLKCGHVTGGTNGYPTPYLGAFIYGFDNYQSAEGFISDNGGTMVICKHRDGWDVWQKHGETSRPLTAEDYLNDLGENYHEATRQTILDMIAEDGEYLSNEQVNNLSKVARRVLMAKDNETVITNDGEYFETVPNETMSYHEDVTTWTVGVFFDRDAEPSEE